MLIAGFDVETTGLDVENDLILEVGAVLWDTERGVPVKCFNALLEWHDLTEIAPRITELTGITLADVKSFGIAPPTALQECQTMFYRADAVCAHNGNLFDKPIFHSNLKRVGLPVPEDLLFIDTTCDIEFPADLTTRKLKHLASEHGFLNPFAHRALFDVLTMLKMAQHYDWDQMVKYAKTPTIALQAETNYQQKELAKKLNYRWNGDSKIWTKSVKEFQLDGEREAAMKAGFTIKVLGK